MMKRPMGKQLVGSGVDRSSILDAPTWNKYPPSTVQSSLSSSAETDTPLPCSPVKVGFLNGDDSNRKRS